MVSTAYLRALFIGTALLAGMAGAACAEETLRVATPQRGAWDTAVPELGQRGGIFKKHGLTLEILYTQAGPESIQSVLAGSMDIATAAGAASAIGTFAKGAPIRLIGSQMAGAPDLFWYVLPSSPVQKIADFNGKTVGYSAAGSSSHTGLLELIKQYDLKVTPVALGGMQATFTQTMTGQVDIGWGSAPAGLAPVAEGKIRIVARGSDVAALRERTARVNLTSVAVLEKRKDAIIRFMRAYRETVDWMYGDPAALTIYGEFSGLPDGVLQQVRGFIPKETMSPDRIAGLDAIVADAMNNKFLAAPLTPEQVKDLIQIPAR
jgi:NitT/TauT family transport system substrate-binding protein